MKLPYTIKHHGSVRHGAPTSASEIRSERRERRWLRHRASVAMKASSSWWIPSARRACSLALERFTDREIAARLGLPLCTVRSILASPLYAGILRDGGLPCNACGRRLVEMRSTWSGREDLRPR